MKRLILILNASVLLLTGCPMPQAQTCNPARHLGTRVAITSIGTADRKFEVRASGFTPNAQARLDINNYPKAGDIIEIVTLDAGGALLWTRFAPLLLTTDPDFEPDADVRTMLVETNSKCFALTTIKEREFGRF